jgi:hypothetical protein
MVDSSAYRFSARKAKGKNLTRAERLRLAPRAPAQALVRYKTLVSLVQSRFESAVKQILFPRLASLSAPLGGVPRFDALPPCGYLPPWYREDAFVSKGDARYADALDELQAEIDKITAGIEGPLYTIGHEVAKSVDGSIEQVLGGHEPGPATHAVKVQQFVRKNVALIKSIPTQALEQIQQKMIDAHGEGLRVESLSADIQDVFGASKAKGNLIARDQTLKLNSQIIQERQQSAGITGYIWTTSHDERVRGNPTGLYPKSQSNHYVLDGTAQHWALAPVTNQKTGARNHPGQDFQCRCIAIPDVERVLIGPDRGAPVPR